MAPRVQNGRKKSTHTTSATAAAARQASGNGHLAASISLKDPSLYVNRELSQLAFQKRVLEEAQDESNPLLERVRFLSILGSNLDEFFMVRVAGLKRQVEAGTIEVGPDGMSPHEQLEAICTDISNLMTAAPRCFRRQLTPALENSGIQIRMVADLNEQQLRRATNYFSSSVFPVLT